MSTGIARLSAAFAAGAVGAVVNSLAVQLAGRLQPGAAPAFSPEWLYPRLVWGGLFGLLLLLPFLPGRPLLRGLVVSLAPTLARLTVLSPAGSSPNGRTVLLTVLFNAVWGIAAAYWLAAALGRTGARRR
jgi:hypothetical protein